MSRHPDILWSGPIREEWTDYNGHLRDAFYLLIISLAGDNLMDRIGLGPTGRATTGHSMFTLECHLSYLKEAKKGQVVDVRYHLLDADAKRLHLAFSIQLAGEIQVCAVAEQLWLNVDMAGPRSSPFAPTVAEHVETIRSEHRQRTPPEQIGRVIGLRPSR